MSLPPLGWRLEHDSALDGRVIHRLDCELVTDEMPRAPDGAVLERHQAPVPCAHCRPDYVSQLAGAVKSRSSFPGTPRHHDAPPHKEEGA